METVSGPPYVLIAPPPIRYWIVRTPESASLAASDTTTGDTRQPAAPAVEWAVGVDAGAVSSSVNAPLTATPALPQASFARSDHV